MKVPGCTTLAGLCLIKAVVAQVSIDLKSCFDEDEYERNLADIEQISSSNLNHQSDHDGAGRGENGITDCHGECLSLILC
jgi:hypothetical protein